MTTINRRLQREACLSVFSKGKRRHIVLELAPPGDVIGLRLKGERTTYYLPLDWCYRLAVSKTVSAEKQRKRRVA